MYDAHFGLDVRPFRMTPDTRLFYPGGGRGELLEALAYAIGSGEGMIKVVGEVGAGKTMVCRMLEERLPEHVDVVYLANPSLKPDDILQAIALELDLPVAGDANRVQVMHALQQYLLEKHARNRRVVMFVEEAQSMPLDTLEEIRLLSNLETEQDKLLQIVLFGQPELDENLAQPRIRQLRERITHSFYLPPFSTSETREYLNHRLRCAGYKGPELFGGTTTRPIAEAADGLTRRINILADKAMLAAYAEDTHDVSRRHVRIAINDSQFARAARRRPSVVAGGALVVAGAVAWGLLGFPLPPGLGSQVTVQSVSSPEPPAAASSAAATGAGRASASPGGSPAGGAAGPPAAPTTVAAAPAAGPPDAVAELAAAVAPAPERPAEPAAGSGAGTVPSTPVTGSPIVAPAEPEVARQGAGATAAAAEPGTAADPPAATVPESGARPAAVAVPGMSADASERQPLALAALDARAPAVGEAVPAGTSTIPGPAVPADRDRIAAFRGRYGPLLSGRMNATRTWLDRVDATHYSIQLFLTGIEQYWAVEQFLARREQVGELDEVFVYETLIEGRPVLSVLFREFELYSDAKRALAALPGPLKYPRPFVRIVSDVRMIP